MADLSQTQVIESLLDRLRRGDETARDELLSRTIDRLELITRKMLRDFPNVRRWNATSDVFQEASIRLVSSLARVEINDAAHFFRLAAKQIRWQLIDLARSLDGAEGINAHHVTMAPDANGEARNMGEVAVGSESQSPVGLAQWTEFHAAVDNLPPEVREVFDLIFYQDLPQEEAATLLGVDTRTIRRRWAKAKLLLGDAMSGKSRLE